MQLEAIPRIWNGDECFIIGGGPSVLDFDASLLRGKRVIAINNAFQDFPQADILYFMDFHWWQWNAESIYDFGGLIFTLSPRFEQSFRIFAIGMAAQYAYYEGQEAINYASNSGLTGIFLAIKLGAGKINLVGFDGGLKNYHDRHQERPPSEVETRHRQSWSKWLPILHEKADLVFR